MSLTIGLALGGGGARGAAHVGVLQVLHENGIRFDHIAGTSAGSVIGAMYAARQDPQWIEQRFEEFISSDDFQALGTKRIRKGLNSDSVMGQMAKFVRNRIVLIMSQQKSFLVKREKLEKTIDFLVPEKKFEDLLIPLIVTSTDLTNGEQVIYNSGNLIDAIVQSCSIPGYVQPTERGEQILVDGGVIDPIPVELVKKCTDYVVAVNITKDSMKEFKDKNIFEFLSRAEQIKSKYLAKSKMEKADFVIHPSVGSLHWSRFDEFDTLLTNGRDAANVSLNELKADLKRKNRLFYRWKQKLGLMS